MDPLNHGAERAFTDRRRRTTTHPWADAYLRAHGIEDAELRAEILKTILARRSDPPLEHGSLEHGSLEHERLVDESGLVMEETQRFLDEQFASFVGGVAPGQEATAGRLLFQRVDLPAQAPAALLDATLAPAALRFQMRTARIPNLPAITRASMASRRAPTARRQENPRSRRWMSLALCLISLVLVTCLR